MTRKRFIKLLMAEGHSRNYTTHLAASLQGKMSYKEGYTLTVTMGSIAAIVGATLCVASRAIAKASVTTAEASATLEAMAKEMATLGIAVTDEETEERGDPT